MRCVPARPSRESHHSRSRGRRRRNARLPPAHDTAERRQVTVMFSDLVGSTAAYQKCVAETVRRFGGYVAKYVGDGVLIYFGYPQAHEARQKKRKAIAPASL
jgi:class 3 adenylate cyclase